MKTPAPPPGAQYVALLQGNRDAPAFILTVDATTRNFTVRKVGAQPEAGKSYELWIVSDKLQRPRSLGVIGKNDFTARPVLAGYDAEIVNQAINQTLSRTIITSLTAWLVVLVFYLFGGEALTGFSFCLVVGFLSGSYSTIYIAAPILIDWAGKPKDTGTKKGELAASR